MLLLRAVHRPPGSMVRSACYGSSSGVKSPSRRLLVRCEEAEADVCDETHNSFPDVCRGVPALQRTRFFTRFGSVSFRDLRPVANLTLSPAAARRRNPSAPGSKRQTYYVHSVLQSRILHAGN